MRKAEIYMHGQKAGMLVEEGKNRKYRFAYDDYAPPPISVTMPVKKQTFEYEQFPPFFEGLLPEAGNLEMLLQTKNINRDDAFAQLMAVGENTVGAATVREVTE